MKQLSIITLIWLCPYLALTQNYFSPLEAYFNVDGTSVYNEMTLDSIDIFDIYYKDIKVTYTENCKVKTMDFIELSLNTDTSSITIEYHPNGLPKMRCKLDFRDTGLIQFDTTWYDNQGRRVKRHQADSEGIYRRHILNSYDNEDRIQNHYSKLVENDDNWYSEIRATSEFVYRGENEIEHHQIDTSYYGFENKIDTFYNDIKAHSYSENGQLIERIIKHNQDTLRTSYTYEEDKILEEVYTVNGTITNKNVYAYPETLPECKIWTNDLWEISPDNEVTIKTYFDDRTGNLKPYREFLDATNTFGDNIQKQVRIADSGVKWKTIEKSLNHYDKNGAIKYSITFAEIDQVFRPQWLWTYETNADRQIIKEETFSFEQDSNTWSSAIREEINTYNSNGDRTSSRITENEGVKNYIWEFTNFGALSYTSSPDWESNYYYSERCDKLKPTVTQPLVFPNPVSENLTILHHNNEFILTAKIFSIDGSLVMDKQPLKSTRINVGHLNAGVYVLQYTTEDDIWEVKFIKI